MPARLEGDHRGAASGPSACQGECDHLCMSRACPLVPALTRDLALVVQDDRADPRVRADRSATRELKST